MNRNWKGMPAALAAGLLGGVLTASASDVSGGAAATGPRRPRRRRPPPAMTAADVEAFLDGLVPTQLAREDIAGAVVVVVKDGKVLFGKGYGFADVEKRKPVSVDDTLFRPGSTSKLFTWTAVMQQVEQGKLDLDKDVNAYLDFKIPEAFGQADHPARHHDPHARVRGLRQRPLHDGSEGACSPSASTSRRISRSGSSRPGRRAAYSNYATAVAGYIVERVSGKPFDDIHRGVHHPAARDGPRDFPAAAPGGSRAAHVEGLSPRLRQGGEVRARQSRRRPARWRPRAARWRIS